MAKFAFFTCLKLLDLCSRRLRRLPTSLTSQQRERRPFCASQDGLKSDSRTGIGETPRSSAKKQASSTGARVLAYRQWGLQHSMVRNQVPLLIRQGLKRGHRLADFSLLPKPSCSDCPQGMQVSIFQHQLMRLGAS